MSDSPTLQRFARLKELFLAAADLPQDQQPAFLQEACQGDDQLAADVARLLRRAADEGAVDTDVIDPADCLSQAAPGPELGEIIGPYKLLEQIGEGGMGIVYVAEQKTPLKRYVALKVIKPGMDTRQVIARFEAERQALAMMDHPHIARVIDGGSTDQGRPYFVMELVRGSPITEFCDAECLTIRQRLELFIQVCQAVQHAHHKGIIHRDLKPSNVLVTMHDDKPVPKVIDFGVAKAVNQPLTEKTIYTQFTQMIGTPLYMSPEQAQLSGQDIDTRSDVYSLGVLLYEILTGTTPFEIAVGQEKGIDELRRMIREEEPAQPSKRISTLNAEAGSTISKNRSVAPRKLKRNLAGELDWVVMRALEKNRARRYPSPQDLAEDLQRHLKQQPVEAGPPSFVYKSMTFCRRNIRSLIVVISLVLTLSVAAGGGLWFSIRELAARRAIDSEKHRGDVNFEKAHEAIRQLGLRIPENRVVSFPDTNDLRQAMLRDALVLYTALLELDPLAADVHYERSQLNTQLGRWKDAQVDLNIALRIDPTNIDYQLDLARLLTRSTGHDLPRALQVAHSAVNAAPHNVRARLSLADVALTDGQFDLAEQSIEQAIEEGAESQLPLLLDLLTRLRDFERVIHWSEIGLQTDPTNALLLHHLASALFESGQLDEALSAANLGLLNNRRAGDPQTAWNYLVRGKVHASKFDYRRALHDLDRAIELNPQLYPAFLVRGNVHYELHDSLGYADLQRAVALRHEAADWLPLQEGLSLEAEKRLVSLRDEYRRAQTDGTPTTDATSAVFAPWINDRALWKRMQASLSKQAFPKCELEIWLRWTIATIAAGDIAMHRECCGQLLKRFESSQNATELGKVAWYLSLSPHISEETRAVAIRFAHRAIELSPRDHIGHQALGMNLLRTGQISEAILALRTGNRRTSYDCTQFALAIAHHRMHNPHHAHDCLLKGERAVEKRLNQDLDDWTVIAATLLLRQEALNEIGPIDPTQPPPTTDQLANELTRLPVISRVIRDNQEVSAHVMELNGFLQLQLDQFVTGGYGKGVERILKSTDFDVFEVDLSTRAVTDEQMTWLPRARSLLRLRLNDTRITDATLLSISDMPYLEHLSLDRTQVTSASMATVAKLRSLRTLSLEDTQVDDAGLAALSSLPNLQRLRLRGTRITDQGLVDIAKLTSLEELSLEHTGITSAALSQLRTLSRLRRLLLAGMHISKDQCRQLHEALPAAFIDLGDHNYLGGDTRSIDDLHQSGGIACHIDRLQLYYQNEPAPNNVPVPALDRTAWIDNPSVWGPAHSFLTELAQSRTDSQVAQQYLLASLAVGDVKSAQSTCDAMKRFIDAQPDDPDAASLAWSMMLLEGNDHAPESLTRYFDEQSEWSPALLLLQGSNHYRRATYPEALESLKALLADPHTSPIQRVYGQYFETMTLHRLNRRDEAKFAFATGDDTLAALMKHYYRDLDWESLATAFILRREVLATTK